jgi:glycine cleavage system regulatory protein
MKLEIKGNDKEILAVEKMLRTHAKRKGLEMLIKEVSKPKKKAETKTVKKSAKDSKSNK